MLLQVHAVQLGLAPNWDSLEVQATRLDVTG